MVTETSIPQTGLSKNRRCGAAGVAVKAVRTARSELHFEIGHADNLFAY